MIQEIDQDIFLADVHAIIHQANCMCNMGSGIAKEIAGRFPEMVIADKKTGKGDSKKLGTFSVAQIVSPHSNPRLLLGYNMYSQLEYGLSTRHTSYDAMIDALAAIKKHIGQWNASAARNGRHRIESIGVPYRIGCNRAGGDWKVVRLLLESAFGDDSLNLIICKNPTLAGEQMINPISR